MPSFVGHVVCHDCGHKIIVSLSYSPGLLSTTLLFMKLHLLLKLRVPFSFSSFSVLIPTSRLGASVWVTQDSGLSEP